MKITRTQLGGIAKELYEFLEHEKIDTIQELQNLLDQKVQIDDKHITIELRPSNMGAQTYSIAYIIKNTGVPIDARINESLSYTKMIVKTTELIEGYTAFSEDLFGNILQDKTVTNASVQMVKYELEALMN